MTSAVRLHAERWPSPSWTPGLRVLHQGPGFEPLKLGGDHEEHAHLAGLRSRPHGRLERLAVLAPGHPARGPKADRSLGHVVDALDHSAPILWSATEP